MSTIAAHDEPSVPAPVGRSRPAAVLPWTWPDGTRVLLAILAISAAVALTVGRTGRLSARRKGAVASNLVLDVNAASPAALAALPHIGPTLARRIAAARADGPFRSREDLRARVPGIGPVTLAALAPHLKVEPATWNTPDRQTGAIAIVDAAANPDVPARTRQPRRSRARKAKGSLVARIPRGTVEAVP